MTKAFQMMIVFAALIAASANATSLRRDVPMQHARMHFVSPDGREIDIAPTDLAMYGQVIPGRALKVKPTLLILSEDTGIRCIKAPCPSRKNTSFDITNIRNVNDNTLYTAVERLSVTDEAVQHAPRTIELTDYSGNPRVRVRYTWFATMIHPNGSKMNLGGNPSSIDMLDESDESDTDVSAQVVIPGWERPVAKARLKELVNGREIGEGYVKELTANRRQGARQTTTFTFVEERKVFCIVAPCPPVPHTSTFRVLTNVKDGCGSRHLIARETNTRAPRALTVVDHTTRLCEDYRPYQWEVQLSDEQHHVRNFGGKAEPVYTIQ